MRCCFPLLRSPTRAPSRPLRPAGRAHHGPGCAGRLPGDVHRPRHRQHRAHRGLHHVRSAPAPCRLAGRGGRRFREGSPAFGQPRRAGAFLGAAGAHPCLRSAARAPARRSHQPSIDIFEAFDELLVLKVGRWVGGPHEWRGLAAQPRAARRTAAKRRLPRAARPSRQRSPHPPCRRPRPAPAPSPPPRSRAACASTLARWALRRRRSFRTCRRCRAWRPSSPATTPPTVRGSWGAWGGACVAGVRGPGPCAWQPQPAPLPAAHPRPACHPPRLRARRDAGADQPRL